ncbi:MAG TPA: glycerol-3-phosphate acyltransferase, partial [Caulobacteraceae bacterium]|nr:glycerol-3-phosphate acyltransferase [Caulobacteraceae bacterium]
FSIWLRFGGGKGFATFLGILLAIGWPVGVAAAVTWLLVAAIFRYSSLASLSAAALAPVWLLVLHQSSEPKLWLTVAMAVLIFARHHQNIRRLLAGDEPRIGAPKATAA